VRDARATLGACLLSLHRQTLRAHEVVAVDDGSSDGSGELLAQAARHDARLRVLRTGPRGLVAALNTALEAARAPLLARMDADDQAHPCRLELQAARLCADPDLDVLGTRVRHWTTPRTPSPNTMQAPPDSGMAAYVEWSNSLLDNDDIVRDLLVESPLVHPSVMMRAALLRGLGGYRHFDGPEDYDLWLRAQARGARFAKLPQAMLRWRDGPLRLTRSDPRYAPARFRELKLRALEEAHLHGARALVVWGAGKVGKGWARALLARGHTLAAFVEVDPRKIGQRIHGAPVVGCHDVPRLPAALHLAAVGQPGARARIREEAARQGLAPGAHLVAVA